MTPPLSPQPAPQDASRSIFATQHHTFRCTCGHPASSHEGENFQIADGRCVRVECPCERYVDEGALLAAPQPAEPTGAKTLREQIETLPRYMVGLDEDDRAEMFKQSPQSGHGDYGWVRLDHVRSLIDLASHPAEPERAND